MDSDSRNSNGHRSAANGRGGAEMICVRGARVHNLRNIDLDIPRDHLVVITGPSGSGKSSLAFDTLFAEGQRQYIESLSAYARQFVHQMERPDVDLIEGLEPTVSIDQRAGSQNPRSTVATVTEVYDYLRLLYARVGQAHCYRCGAPIRQQTPEQIIDTLLRLAAGSKVILLAPLVRGRKGKHPDAFELIRKGGLLRARVDGQVYELDQVPELAPRKNHTIEAVVDRLILRENIRPRLAESVQLALRHGEGLLTVLYAEAGPGNGQRQAATSGPRAGQRAKSALAASESGGGAAAQGAWQERLFSTHYACPACDLSYEELEPRTFSFNSPYGACPTCDGLGALVAFDPELVVCDTSRSLATGAIAPWAEASPAARARHRRRLAAFLSAQAIRWSTPLARLKPKVLDMLLRGNGKHFEGVLAMLEGEYAAARTDAERQRLDEFRASVPCAECRGARLRREAQSVLVGKRAIHEVTAMSVADVRRFFAGLELADEELTIARPLLVEIASRLEFLDRVGLDYLSLDRPADTLSGGELQRVRLATGIGSGLVGVCYILDEPSIGLHPRDNQRLIDSLRRLQQQGNTVLVVEHDEAVMRQADYLFDLGPGAGVHGGSIVAHGTPDEVCRRDDSLTGRYLSGKCRIPLPARRRKATVRKSITIEGAATNNLKEVTVRFPLGVLVCVTGVSGSGKSSLLNETFARAVKRHLGAGGPRPGPFRRLTGVERIDKLVEIDQSPIGRTPRSNPATYSGVFDEIRKVFTNTREARLRGYKAGRFSFNVKGGRCETCQGQGLQKIEMNFLPDLYVECPQCRGKRFNRPTLEVGYRDKSIADVLDMRVDEACVFFENFSLIRRLLECLQEVGLGYLTLGQPCTTLSGGEAQRIKLATELSRTSTGRTLYLLDEPTTGLHFDDIQKLLLVLERLVDLGNTVIVIEHQLDVIKSADWIIDLGPEGGDSGGQIVATGTPEEVAALADNATGRFLRPVLEIGAASG